MNVEDLEVYKKLLNLTIKIHDLTMKFPKHELYELGSQLRRSSNSAAANLAEGFGNKHTSIYTECISRSQGEIRETIHHLRVSFLKKYMSEQEFDNYLQQYIECSKMLFGLHKALKSKT